MFTCDRPEFLEYIKLVEQIAPAPRRPDPVRLVRPGRGSRASR
ncbi:hypothetical protein ACFPM0_13105 [Pseudonocardia sulfidoxydans]